MGNFILELLANIFGEIVWEGGWAILGGIWGFFKERFGWWGGTFVLIGIIVLVAVLCVGATRLGGTIAEPR